MAVNEHRPTAAEFKFDMKEGGTESSATFIFGDEDHTLGNALRHVLMQNRDVDFCGYSVPHPSEPKMNMRLQTTGRPALEVLKEGLRDLRSLCDILEERVDEALPDPEEEESY
ncbi:unnamed protein product [Ascophyllum nodosum]